MPLHSLQHAQGSIRNCQHRRSLRRWMHWKEDLSHALNEGLWHDPYGLLAGGEPLHTKLNCSVVRIATTEGSFVLKHQDSGRLLRRVRKSLSRCEARHSWEWSCQLERLGILTPRPFALVEQRLGPFRTSSFLLSEYVSGTTLYRLLRQAPLVEGELCDIAQQLAAIWARLEKGQLCHNDFKPENLLVDDQNRLWLIDFDRMRHEPNEARRQQRQAGDLSDLFHPRSWRKNPLAAEIFQKALLQEPCIQKLMESRPAARQWLQHPLQEKLSQTGRLTVLIPCYNAADSIQDCIASVRDIADEILVADAGSTDETLTRVRQAGGCRIVQMQHAGPLAFATWAQTHVQYPWTLRLLPQEQLNPELGRQIQDLLAEDSAKDGYLISQAVRFKGRRLEFGEFPRETSLRLYRSSQACHELHRNEVRLTLASEDLGRLKSCLLYDWTPAHEERSVTRLQASRKFLHSYLVRGGWLDGQLGFEACCESAFFKTDPPEQSNKGNGYREAA